MRKLVYIISNKFDFIKNNLFFRQINANCEIIIIINFLNKLLFNFKNNLNDCVYNLKSINIKFHSILFDVKIRFTIDDDIFVNILNTKYIRGV